MHQHFGLRTHLLYSAQGGVLFLNQAMALSGEIAK
jgi:hypothetical protein